MQAGLMEGPGGQHSPSHRLRVPWGLAAFGATRVTSMSPWVLVLGRTFETTRPGLHGGFSPPVWHMLGKQAGGLPGPGAWVGCAHFVAWHVT